MKFRAEHYYQAALERIEQAKALYDRGNSYALAVYVAGLAVECMLRAFRLRKDTTFDERHDLLLLFKVSGMFEADERRRQQEGLPPSSTAGVVGALASALNPVYVLWSNDVRYASEERMRARVREKKLHRGMKGNVLKAASRRLLGAAQEFIAKGVLLWPFSRS